jgi:peptide/nickel transport system ATP-binding protein
MCIRVAVIYKGKIVEIGTSEDIFSHWKHPYVEALIAASTSDPAIWNKLSKYTTLRQLPPTKITGYIFSNRCPYKMEICEREEPKLIKIGEEHFAACHLIA